MANRALPIDKLAAGTAFALGLVTILAALGSEHIGGLVPCELCLEQRTPYYWALPILGLVLVLWNRIPLAVWYVAMAIVFAIFAFGLYLGVYHAGAEWLFWPGPTSCTGVGDAISFDALGDLDSARVVPCDQVQFRFLGVSLAGYNALISLGILVLLAISIFMQWRRRRTV